MSAVLLTSTAYAQPYGGYDRGPSEYDRGPGPGYDRGPPPRYDDRGPRRDDYDRPPPRFVCFVDPPPPFPRRRCPTRPGRPGSPCRCDGAPFEGHRDFAR